MPSSYPLVDRSPLPTVDSPMALQKRGAGNGDGAVSGAGKLGFGENSGRLGFGSTEGFGSRAEKSGFGAAENLGLGASAEKVGFGAGGYGGGGGTGGKLRSSRRAKKTPYDRPAIGRHATPGGSAAMAAASMASSKSTIASRLRDSASRLISSSASYLFSSLFKRRSLGIKANGGSHTAGGITVEEKQEEETLEAPANQDDQNNVFADQLPALNEEPKPAEIEKGDLDIVQVEEILKQKTWSREQVNHLTEILQTRVCENNAASPSLEAGKPQEQPKKVTDNSTPVQVARAYMGEKATRPSGIAASIRSPAYQSVEVQPSPGHSLLEDRYMSSPFSRTWARSSAAVRMPKRSFALEEDDLIMMGPVRRVRQRTSMPMNTSPYSYSRRMTGSGVPLRTLASPPPTQSSQTALRILETLEKLSPSPKGKLLEAATEKSPIEVHHVLDKFSLPLKGKSLDESGVVAGMSPSEQTPETSKAREKRVAVLPKSTELSPSGKSTLGGLTSTDSEALRKSTESPALIPGSPIIISERTKGFRMNAVFEESNSDEESKPHAKLPSSSEARHPATLLNVKEAASVAPVAPVVSPTTTDVPVSTTSSLPMPVQSHVSPAPSFNFTPKSSSSPATFLPPEQHEPLIVSPVSAFSEKPTPNLTSFRNFSFPSAGMETESPLSNAPATPPALAASVSVEKVFIVSTTSAETPASSTKLTAPAEVPEGAVISTPASVMSLVAASNSTVSAASLSAAGLTAVPLFGNISTIASGDLLSPVSTPSKTIAAHEDLSEAENGVTMATENPFADKLTEFDTMATDFMAEEADTFLAPSVPAFQLGVISTASPVSTFSFGASAMSSPSPAFSFAAGAPASASSAATTAFGGQLGTVSAGQALTFGVMPSPPANPFSSSTAGNSSSAFMFGSSTAAASTSAVFTAKSSGLPSFAGTSSAFQFGAFATPSPLSSPFTSSDAANSSSGFSFLSSPAPVSSATPTFSFGVGAASSQSSGPASAGQPFTISAAQPNPFAANQFASSGAPNSASTFQFGPPAMAAAPSTFSFASAGAPTASPPSLFGSNAASNSSNTFSFGSNAASNLSSSFAFGPAQPAVNPMPFTFGGQTAASPASGQPPFGFGGGQPAMLAQSSFSAVGAAQPGSNAASSSSSSFAFGPAQPAASPVPFTFGGQTAASPGQPFGFGGGQPAMPAQSSFSAAGVAQPGLDFAGGFALGATGGEKSGRKYIKAKRAGGAKRGK